MTERDRGKPGGPKAGPSRPRRPRETAADRARLGTVIAGSYRIDEIIGRGAIGAVFGGIHLRLERPVAVKFVDPSLVDDPEIRARFKREAKIAASIGSSHVVEVFDYGVGEDGAPFLVMERLMGEDVHARIQREGRLSIERALRIGKQVCRALGAAHATGIIHRDLKPENVFLVERDGQSEFVKVVDFGLSTFVQSDDTRLTRAGQSVGTPLYMAPEQAGANLFDARVDVYSLGVLIFEMTTGRLPFEAPNLQALLVALATKPPRSIRFYDPKLPVQLDEMVSRFVARDPNRRPKSAAAALAEILALEERLEGARAESAQVRVRDVAIDGLPGPLPGPFAGEVGDHLERMRRTGRLSTADASGEARALAELGSSSTEVTHRMHRHELDEIIGATPARAERPKPARPADERPVEEDSVIFYGRVGPNGSPMSMTEGPVLAEPSGIDARTTIPAAPRRPPAIALYAAIAAFVIVAVVVIAALRGN
jgi:serine/threonine-protein kinase